MSALKIKRDIKLLEQQLNELEANISDPIERNEQKKQLEREIKKLKRSKSQIEQLEQEQQELESLKSEFILNNNELVDRREIKQEKQVQHTASIIDTSIPVEPKIELNKQIESNRNSQVGNLNHKEENSDIITPVFTPVISPSNNSKESGKAWIIGGTIGFFIFLGLVINGYIANQTASNIEQQTSDTITSETFEQDNIPETDN